MLGVTEAVVESALHQAQAFWAKGVELQQVGRERVKGGVGGSEGRLERE